MIQFIKKWKLLFRVFLVIILTNFNLFYLFYYFKCYYFNKDTGIYSNNSYYVDSDEEYYDENSVDLYLETIRKMRWISFLKK